MYPPISAHRTSKQSLLGFSEAGRGSPERGFNGAQHQADRLLSDPSSRGCFETCKADVTSMGFPRLTLTGDNGAVITSDLAATAAGSTTALKSMNTDVDQVRQMLESHATPELFSELKDHSKQEAIDFAVANPEFQGQAMHDMDDPAFQQEVRIRLTGAP